MHTRLPVGVTTATVASAILLFTATLCAQQPPSTKACVPTCRAGFLCLQGQCVSACNPPCAANETCTPNGQCVSACNPPCAASQTCTPTGECVQRGPATTPTAAPPAPPVLTGPPTPAPPPPQTVPATTAAPAASSPTGTATGEPQPVPPAPAVIAEPAHAPAGVRTHDGFYFRFGLGGGLLAGGTVSPPGFLDISLSGGGIPVELAFGGTLPNGLVLGGGIYGISIPSPSYSNTNGVSANGGGAILSSIGPFVDWYPNPENGAHIEAAIGFAVVSAGKGTDTNGGSVVPFPPKDESGNGFSLLLGGGYEWWVGEQLSLGLLARLQYVSASVQGSGDTTSSSVKTWIPALLGTLTYQ